MVRPLGFGLGFSFLSLGFKCKSFRFYGFSFQGFRVRVLETEITQPNNAHFLLSSGLTMHRPSINHKAS